MGGFDLTDIGGNAQGNIGSFNQPVRVSQPVQQQPQQEVTPTVDTNDVDAVLSKPIIAANKKALAEEQGINTSELWNPLSEARPGGQFKAGEVDEKQEKFLSKTEWDTSATKDHVFPNRRIS